MSTPDGPYPPGQQEPGGQGGYQPPQYQQGGQQQGQYQQPQYGQPQYQQGQYQQGQHGYGQNPQAGPYQQGAPYQQAGPYGPMPQGPYMQPGYGVSFEPGSYLAGGGVGFGAAIKLAFQNAFMYQGRASRSAYWWFALFSFIIGIGVDGVIVGIAGNGGAGAGVAVISWLVSLTMFIVGLPLIVRRLHDTDRSGGWVFIGLIPIVGAITLFVFSLLDGTPGPNRFG